MKVKELEAQLRLLYIQMKVTSDKGSGLHARHNSYVKKYVDTLQELERISLKWKIKRLIKKFRGNKNII